MSTETAENKPAESAFKPEITFDDFAKVDLRVAKITQAEPHPNADRLLKLQLDDGSGTPRQICAGVKDHYNAEDLIGKSIVIVANLAPRTLRGEESKGMLLAASDSAKGSDERNVVLLTPMGEIEPGSVVS
jgi:methionine--tRNA ligase beta chain